MAGTYHAGTNTQTAYVGRLHDNGTWDTSFTGTGSGVDTFNLSIQDKFIGTFLYDMHELADGKFLLAGARTYLAGNINKHPLLIKFLPKGQPTAQRN